MRIIITMFTIALSLMSQGCNGQKKEYQKDQSSGTPQTSIKVNKEYDKNGNIIRYDSTYSHYYSNVKNDKIKRDSIFSQFRNQLNQKYLFSNEPYFNDLFFQDSLLKYDFYKRDFFSNRFRDNMRKMDSLFLQMDAMKDDFFNHQFPEKDKSKKK